MTYRDDLDAAHARIAALETELERGGGDNEEAAGDRDNMAEEIKQLRTIVEERRVKIAELRGERDRLAARMLVLERESRALPALPDHNRGFPALTDGTPTRIACPSCRDAGIESELVQDIGLDIVSPESRTGVRSVACPRCLFVGVLRRR